MILQHQWTFNIVLQARDSKGCMWGTDKSESSDDNNKSTTLSVLWSVLAFQVPPRRANQKSIYTTPLTFTRKCLLLFSELFRHNYLRPNCYSLVCSDVSCCKVLIFSLEVGSNSFGVRLEFLEGSEICSSHNPQILVAICDKQCLEVQEHDVIGHMTNHFHVNISVQ